MALFTFPFTLRPCALCVKVYDIEFPFPLPTFIACPRSNWNRHNHPFITSQPVYGMFSILVNASPEAFFVFVEEYTKQSFD